MPAVHGAPAPATPLEDRGITTFPAQVVARIAEQVASEVPHIGSDAGGVLGVGARRDFASRPSGRGATSPPARRPAATSTAAPPSSRSTSASTSPHRSPPRCAHCVSTCASGSST